LAWRESAEPTGSPAGPIRAGAIRQATRARHTPPPPPVGGCPRGPGRRDAGRGDVERPTSRPARPASRIWSRPGDRLRGTGGRRHTALHTPPRS